MQFPGEIDVHVNDPAHSAVIYFDDTASELSWINCCRSQNAGQLLHASADCESICAACALVSALIAD